MPLDGLEVNPSVVGPNIAGTRKRASISQAELAKRLGVSRPTLAALETGQRIPSPTMLAQIASELGITVRDLVVLDPIDEQALVRFRDPLRTNEPARLAVDALIDFGRYYSAVEAKAKRKQHPRIAPPLALHEGIDVDHAAQDLAAAERARLNLGDGPIQNVELTLEQEVGVLTFGLPQLSETRIAGIFVFASDRGLIGLNIRQADRRRQNWTIAHEYAHFLTNRYEPEITFEAESKKLRDRHEQFAEIFAANFLMPTYGLSRRFAELLGGIPRATVGHIILLANQYQVSFQAMCRRLESIDRIPKNTYDYVISRGLKPVEAERSMGIERRSQKQVPYPLSYIYMLSVMWRNASLSEGDIARYLKTDRLTARGLLEVFEGDEQFPIDEPLESMS